MKYIEELGGAVSEEGKYVEEIVMLVTGNLSRSEKALCCVGAGKPICHPAYIHDSYAQRQFLPVVSHSTKPRSHPISYPTLHSEELGLAGKSKL